MLLFPRLTASAARDLATEYSKREPNMLRATSLSYTHAFYTPTGGNRVDTGRLEAIREEIRSASDRVGFPGSLTDSQRNRFDALCARVLHSQMDISPAEAARPGLWEFMACAALPDIVRWRFPGPGGGSTSLERFLGGTRGLRNTFGRVWWRATTLYEVGSDDPYALLFLLGEDELVQITERPNLAGNTRLAIQVARCFLETLEHNRSVTRSELLRDAMKRLRRLLPVVAFDALSDEVLKDLVDGVFAESVASFVTTASVPLANSVQDISGS